MEIKNDILQIKMNVQKTSYKYGIKEEQITEIISKFKKTSDLDENTTKMIIEKK